ncbi:hypothetical protein SMACR_00831 [Sordaria macrospora]|uniref:WGS project CABT00000000 data, contig 2.2 n=2 Tax=Sordaria macrospora TaxID=5147 RepID=F7VN72_SORMK|nr:uncharacterized protein SMAC_00831 [Sordaria macrospora k-hell]KAA8634687.1 hypothetical protein SMACR_00831 [Sordaria macrospora]WPJ61824.1 hypothetical protein SMAC4_00831 [Sordaria macrospora]CCC06801.1 unnamed protein product [Sordaria macrospora k-hell]
MADQTPQASKPTTPAISTPTPTPGSGPTISSSASTSSSRPYVPQFSAATQLILQRLKAKEGKNDGGGDSFSSVVSSTKTIVVTGGGSPTIKLEPDAFEDAKKRLVAGTGLKTSTSMSLKMPLSQPSMKMPTPTLAPKTTTTATKKNLSLPSSSVSTVARAASTTNLSLPLPPPQPPKHRPLTFKSGTTSAIKNINSGLTASGKVSVIKPPKPAAAAASEKESKPKKAKTSTGNPVGRPSNSSKAAATAAAAAAADSTGSSHRRKRIKQHQDVDELSSLSSLSDVSEPEEAGPATPSDAQTAPLLTMTKSGRQVLKPTTYNPATVDAANKKHRGTNSSTHGHYGKHRTAEQALCKKCTRLHSPASNPMVFCDGCNEGWHQRCHDPVIPTEVIRDQTKGWVCAVCVGKRGRHLVGKKQQKRELEQQQQQQQQGQPKATKESWADKPPQQKRAYLSTLPPQELVGLLMLALEVKPDLPIFPGPPSPPPSAKMSNGNGHKGKGLKDLVLSRETSQENQGGEGEDEEEYDPLAALWPKPGNGLYSLLPFDVDDDEYLVDSGDFEAFSSIMYDDRGRKVLENGLRV